MSVARIGNASSRRYIAARTTLLAALTLVVLVAACSSTAHERDTGSQPDAAQDAGRDAAPVAPLPNADLPGPPPQDRTRRITLWPFWEAPLDQGQQPGTPDAPLGGVMVCVVRARGLGSPWSDFVETDGPCAPPTVAGEKVVLEGVPAMAELLITATKEGYRPRVFGLVSSAGDLDLTMDYPGSDLHGMSLSKQGAIAQLVSDADPALGDLSVALIGIYFRAVVGARLALEPGGGRGPYFWVGGVVDPEATATLDGSFVTGGPAEALEPTSWTTPGATFIDLPEGDYVLRVTPPEGARMACGGIRSGSYPSGEVNTVRVPILAGHSTIAGMACVCTGDDPGWEAEVEAPCVAVADAGMP